MSEDLITNCVVCGTPFVTYGSERAAGDPLDRCPMCRRIAPAPGRQRGLIKWYSRSKGYGFITPPRGPELFFHKSGLVVPDAVPQAGQMVEFTADSGPRGSQAEAVTILTRKQSDH